MPFKTTASAADRVAELRERLEYHNYRYHAEASLATPTFRSRRPRLRDRLK